MTKKIVLLTFCAIFLFVAQPAFAVDIPNFPSCLNPQGTLKADYKTGNHGIVGRTGSVSGSDKVYKINDDTLIQCFCAENGEGIQTNWWRIRTLSESQTEILKRSGWYYIANGALWGLDSEPYLAKNTTYSCNAGIGGSVLGTEDELGGKVLGLANTGSYDYIYNLWLYSLLILTAGVWLKKIHVQKRIS